jgi:hypothetical protein
MFSTTQTAPGSITFGGWDYCIGWTSAPPPDGGFSYSHTWTLSAIPEHLFSWWFYGLPSSASENVQDLADTVAQAKTANLFAGNIVVYNFRVHTEFPDPSGNKMTILSAKVKDQYGVEFHVFDSVSNSGGSSPF